MAPLRWAATLLLAGTGQVADAHPHERWEAYVDEASIRFDVPENWIRRVMLAESGGKTFLAGGPITSRAGAMGLMQLMPATWQDMRKEHGLGPDPYDPRDNILAGAAYLHLMYGLFGYPGLFGAYNAGPGRFRDYLMGRARLPHETSAYIALVQGPAPRGTTLHSAAGSKSAPSGLFVLERRVRERRAHSRSFNPELFALPATRDGDDPSARPAGDAGPPDLPVLCSRSPLPVTERCPR